MAKVKIAMGKKPEYTGARPNLHYPYRIEPGVNRFGIDGNMYDVYQDGDIVGCRDKHAKHGDIRMFWRTDDHGQDTPVFYVFDRKFKSLPFRAPFVWWRRIEFDVDERMKVLEDFANDIAKAEWPDAVAIKKRARKISKEGFLQKLKGEYGTS